MNDGVPFAGNVFQDGEVRYCDGRPVITRGGQFQRISNVERLGLPGSQFALRQVETTHHGAQYRGVLEDMMEPRLLRRIGGDDDCRNARSQPVEFKTDATGLAVWDDFVVRRDGNIAFGG